MINLLEKKMEIIDSKIKKKTNQINNLQELLKSYKRKNENKNRVHRVFMNSLRLKKEVRILKEKYNFLKKNLYFFENKKIKN